MNNLPNSDSRLDPPVRHARIGVCPQCGNRDISEVVIMYSYRYITSWDGDCPLGTEIDCEEDIGYKAPRYYCSDCGWKFATPEFKIVVV